MYQYKLKEIEVGDTEIIRGKKSTVTDIDPVTGGITWDVVDAADFSSVYKALAKAKNFLDDLDNKSEKTKMDPVIDKLAADIADLFNEFRTHVRKKYPEEYERVKRLKENDIEEMSTTGGGAGAASFTPGTGMQYATPYAFRLKGKKPNIKAYKELGYKEVKENIGATLGPGPKASSDGVKDSAYVKQFKYKLVPKKIKGSGLEVKQLFEDDTPQAKFQKKRVDAFNVIEKELNDIYKMISNAKDETLDYYKDNPSSYAIVKSTDLVIDYLRDIKSLLKIQ
tara:strand:- start:845 stop:1687 length:843 start_codon:yes stop_codon:yes gene_type:complete